MSRDQGSKTEINRAESRASRDVGIGAAHRVKVEVWGLRTGGVGEGGGFQMSRDRSSFICLFVSFVSFVRSLASPAGAAWDISGKTRGRRVYVHTYEPGRADRETESRTDDLHRQT